ncbi:alpha/beta hydrolase [Christiangramia salexigens]|uniref:Alpha/beta hydrolase n=1 Tax=Christiangramia salexigens TaxID=1913577 RepID=A0A1L3J8E1_9FLAO|nr:alpha/beta fold hydrolase [Christiangramia salexigens]APG61381.1 alpha/beta hydrolase [Christiangramia salexigens]
MKNLIIKLRVILAIISITVFLISCTGSRSVPSNVITLAEQGSFAVGGTVISSSGTFDPIQDGAFNPTNQNTSGQTLHGDHASVFYQIPAEPRKLPLVFWHGYGQSMRTWQTTPDGREGFQSIFLRKDFPVYLIDQPRRGLSGRSTEPISISASTDDQLWFGIFRLGLGNDFYPGVQFSKDPEALNQFFRQMTPDTGPLSIEINIKAVSALFDKIGPSILVTHSHSGGQGWLTALKNNNIKAIVSYEPGSNFVFPENEVPAPMQYLGGELKARGVPISEFKRLTEIPIIIYYGDYIPEEPVVNPGKEQWRVALSMAKKWRDIVNKYGGDVTLVPLPEAGLKGNTHFPMSDLNNKKVADLMYNWLKEKGLTKKEKK